jgi:hypothetical protein
LLASLLLPGYVDELCSPHFIVFVIVRKCRRVSNTSNNLYHELNVLYNFYHVYVPNFSSFGPIELILTQVVTFVACPALPVTWSTNLIFYVISIAQLSMCAKFQLFWSNRTHSDPRCYFCGTSSTFICMVHKPNVLCCFYCSIMYMYQISALLVQ